MQTVSNAVSGREPQAHLPGEFFNDLSLDALTDLMSIEHPSSYPPNKVLFSEDDAPSGVFVVLEGEVKLSINSSDGRSLTLRIARKGEILGLVSTMSGNPCEMTASALYPAKVARISRREFLAFLARHPETYKTVTEELGRQIAIACEQLRRVGLETTAPAKLARLLIDWSKSGQTTDSGTKFSVSLTHEQIGEFIGTSRETVTRTLSAFKSRHLVAFNGTSLTIPSRDALENFACC
jgi:CRP/FNR family transcriptional regulator